MTRNCIATVGIVVLSVMGSADAAALRTVALTGQQAPGTAEGVTYDSFANHFYGAQVQVFRGPVLNDLGQTAFRANLTGSGVSSSNNLGVWSKGSGDLSLVARTGSDAPGGGTFSTVAGLELLLPVLNNAGQTAFFGGLTNGDMGLWSEGAGSLAVVARDGIPAPGTQSGVNFRYAGFSTGFDGLKLHMEWPRLNDAGQTSFFAPLTGSGVNNTNFTGIWSGNANNLEMAIRAGSQATGLPDGVIYAPFALMSALNNAGQVAFFAYVDGAGVNDTNSVGIWAGTPGSIDLLARIGDHAPGTPSGVNFSHTIGMLGFNNAGHVAFAAGLTGSGIDDTNNEGLWSNASGSLALIARRGNPAPDTADGVNFDTFITWPVLNDRGQILFSSALVGSGVDDTNNQAVWLEDNGMLMLVARSGNQAPGTAEGVNFSSFGQFPSLNSAGQIAFRADVGGIDVDSTNNRGIWATDAAGALQLLARTGDELEVAPGDFRTLSDLDFSPASGNSDGRSSGFNNLGQLVFWAQFTDGSEGILVSNAVAGLPGDFNGDGTVDAADYVHWRKNDLTPDAYSLWRANFGRTLPAGSGSALPSAEPLSATVPEPATHALATLMLLGLFGHARRYRNTRT